MKKIKKIIAITMVKNEMDIIESFVRHTLTFADMMIVTDHMSSDKTRQILAAMVDEGLPIILHDVHQAMHMQFEKMNEMLAEALSLGADLVLPLDADEFILPATPDHTVREELKALDAEQVYLIHWRKYAPCKPYDDEDKFIFARPLYQDMRWDDGQKVLVGAEAARRHELGIIFGNHFCFEHGDMNRQYSKSLWLETIYLAHLYWRSHEQIAAKQFVKMINLTAKMSKHSVSTRDYFQQVHRFEQNVPIEFTEYMPDYEQAELPKSLPCPKLLYSHDVRPRPLAALLQASLDLAEDYSELQVLQRRIPVTIVVPYLGKDKDDAWQISMKSAEDEIYPYKEIIVPMLAGNLSDRQRQQLEAKSIRVIWDNQGHENDILKKMAAQVSGKYAAWLLPGETARPKRIQSMLTSMILQEFSIPLYFSNVQTPETYESCTPYINFPSSTSSNFNIIERADTWSFLLNMGCYFSRGFAGVLCRRDLMDKCGWFTDCFLDGQPLRMSMWQRLLTTEIPNGTMYDKDMVILGTDYTGKLPPATIDDYVRHQIEWRVWLDKEKASLGKARHKDKLVSWRQKGKMLHEKAAENHIDTSTPLWILYDNLLAQD